MATLSFGVIGVGAMGSVHASNLAERIPGARLVAISDIDHVRAEECASRLGVANAYSDADKLLGDPAVQVVVIATPAETHGEIIRAAAERGLHIFCEKPMDSDIGAIDQALAAVRKARVRLTVGFHRRFDRSFRAAFETIRSGSIGVPHTVHLIGRDPVSDNSGPGRPGDLFVNTTIHDFDLARWLMGEEVTEVYVAGGVMGDRSRAFDDPNLAITMLRFESGAIGTIDNSRLSAHGYDQRAEVFGSRGMVSVGNERSQSAVLEDATGLRAASPRRFFIDRYAEAYVGELREFVRYVNGEGATVVMGEEARRASLLAGAAWLSYSEGRPVLTSEVGG